MMLFTSVTLSFFGTGRLLPVVDPACRRAAWIACSRLMRRNASMVAFSTLCGLFVPSVFVRMSWTPAASSTGRTAPPAMTPVPWAAGFRYTRAAPKWPVISHGMVVSLQRHEDQVLLGVLHRLPDGLGHLARLAEPHTHVAVAVADDHQRGEGEPPAALDHLGHPVDGDHPVRQIQRTRIDRASATRSPPVLDPHTDRSSGKRPSQTIRRQNPSPPVRAASASALTRP